MLHAILIDDEKNSRDALRKKIESYCPAITIVAECSNGLEGLDAIRDFRPEVVFLDIEMPHMNGFAMLEQVPDKNFHLVFTTAYNQYAIHAIRLGAFDYLVKPVDNAELKELVKRIEEQKSTTSQHERLQLLVEQLSSGQKKPIQKIAVSTQEGLEILTVDEIQYMEAIGNYTQIYFTAGKPLLASRTLKEFEDLLQEEGFFRVHNASLVHLKYVKKYIRGDGGQVVLMNGQVLDVARRRKDELINLLGKIAPRA
ncbi:MAG: response regulator transcription factor [Chitinophagaceae bacterium]|nr:response regulator transcription factor [Chitinophagaceae bacterium]